MSKGSRERVSRQAGRSQVTEAMRLKPRPRVADLEASRQRALDRLTLAGVALAALTAMIGGSV